MHFDRNLQLEPANITGEGIIFTGGSAEFLLIKVFQSPRKLGQYHLSGIFSYGFEYI